MNRQNRQLFHRSALIAGLLFLLFLYLPREETFLWFNQFTNTKADAFFKAANFLGDGWILLPLAVLALFIDFRFCVSVVLLSILVLLFVSIGKQWFFSDVMRPAGCIDLTVLETVEGIRLARHRSFPSGHTTTAFAIAYLILSRIKNSGIRSVIVVLAICAGFARVYLVQHFPEDIAMGAILGIAAAAITIYITANLSSKWDRSLNVNH